MLALIAANLRRRRARTFLTAAGIAVGVAAVAVTAWAFGRAALIRVTIGVLGAMYPIWRVNRIRASTASALA